MARYKPVLSDLIFTIYKPCLFFRIFLIVFDHLPVVYIYTLRYFLLFFSLSSFCCLFFSVRLLSFFSYFISPLILVGKILKVQALKERECLSGLVSDNVIHSHGEYSCHL